MARSIAIIGAGGMGRDALLVLDALDLSGNIRAFYEQASYWRDRCIHSIPVRPLHELDTTSSDVLVALGDGELRRTIIQSLPRDTRYPTFVHPSTIVGRKVELGPGTLVSAGCILTTDITIGRHVQINIGTSIAHDCVVGDFSTLSPGVSLSGNCIVEQLAFLGTRCVVREKCRIGAGTTIGMGAVVVRDALDGVWVGNPARRRQ